MKLVRKLTGGRKKQTVSWCCSGTLMGLLSLKLGGVVGVMINDHEFIPVVSWIDQSMRG